MPNVSDKILGNFARVQRYIVLCRLFAERQSMPVSW